MSLFVVVTLDAHFLLDAMPHSATPPQLYFSETDVFTRERDPWATFALENARSVSVAQRGACFLSESLHPSTQSCSTPWYFESTASFWL